MIQQIKRILHVQMIVAMGIQVTIFMFLCVKKILNLKSLRVYQIINFLLKFEYTFFG